MELTSMVPETNIQPKLQKNDKKHTQDMH